MKTWSITGASSGLGLVVTAKLLARGERMAACGRRAAPFGALQRTVGDSPRVACFDLADDMAALRQEADTAFAAFGRIETVVGEAGHGSFGAAEADRR